MPGSKNNIANRGVKTHDHDHTLIISYRVTPAGTLKRSKRWAHVDGITERLAKGVKR